MNIMTEIERAYSSITGWCSWQKAETLAAMVISLRPSITIEIGVWGGKSLIPMAMAHQSIGQGIVIAVDPWMASASIDGQDKVNSDWWKSQRMHDDVYSEFMRQRTSLGLQHRIKVERRSSNDFVPPTEIGILHIDGNHGEQAIKDAEKFCPNIIVGGISIIDDVGWSTGTIMKACVKVEEMGFRKLYSVNDKDNQWAVYQKIR